MFKSRKNSAVKLEQTGPAEKESEVVVVEHELQVMLTPAPPGPKVDGTEPSVHTCTSVGGREPR